MSNYFKREDMIREGCTGERYCRCEKCFTPAQDSRGLLPTFPTRAEAVAHIRKHGGSASYPGGVAIFRERMHS